MVSLEFTVEHILTTFTIWVVPLTILLLKYFASKKFTVDDDVETLSILPYKLYKKINKINTLPNDLFWLSMSLCLITWITTEQNPIDTTKMAVKCPVVIFVLFSLVVFVAIYRVLLRKYRAGEEIEIKIKNDILDRYSESVYLTREDALDYNAFNDVHYFRQPVEFVIPEIVFEKGYRWWYMLSFSLVMGYFSLVFTFMIFALGGNN